MNIVSKDVNYAVEIAGNGEPLVLLHGFTGNRDTWKFLIPLLSDRYTLDHGRHHRTWHVCITSRLSKV